MGDELSLKEVRKRAGKSIVWVSGAAGTSTHTTRIYELDPQQVSPEKRQQLDPVYDRMAQNAQGSH